MAGIPEEVIDQVRDRADIVDVIQSYIPLKKNGRDFMACCPFHQEKTPSFHVRPDRQYYHCFGCGKHGNAITFVMERENVDFPTAVRLLAQKYSVFIPEKPERPQRNSGTASRQYPQESTAGEMKDRLYLLMERMREWFVKNLNDQPQSPVAQYLATRQLSAESIHRFSLGISLDSWDAGMNHARNLGFTLAELAAGGLIKTFEDNPSKRYDLFRNRLMFPIWDELGRVVGFSARTIESDPKAMKYVNTPETPIFKKGRILYGMHLARTEMADTKKGFALLCEGQLDVIAMHAAGFANAVAAEGTAFTQEQARMLRRYTGKIRLALDSDAAGQKAIFRDVELLLPLGFDIKVVHFPGGKDPDELLRTQGAEAIAGAVDSAMDLFEFALQTYSEQFGNSPAGKAQTATKLLHLASLMESDAAKAAYSAWIGEKLGVSADGMYAELERLAEKEARERARYERYEQERQKNSGATDQKVVETPLQKQYRKALYDVLKCTLASEAAADAAGSELPPELLDHSPAARAVNQVIQSKMLDEWSDAASEILKNMEDSGEITQELSGILMAEPPEIPEKEALQIVRECAGVIRECSVSMRIEFLTTQFAGMAPDSPERMNVLKELAELSKKRAGMKNV